MGRLQRYVTGCVGKVRVNCGDRTVRWIQTQVLVGLARYSDPINGGIEVETEGSSIQEGRELGPDDGCCTGAQIDRVETTGIP